MSELRFQRRHYEAVAEVMRECRKDFPILDITVEVLDQVTHRLSLLFMGDNPNFKPERFRKATEE